VGNGSSSATTKRRHVEPAERNDLGGPSRLIASTTPVALFAPDLNTDLESGETSETVHVAQGRPPVEDLVSVWKKRCADAGVIVDGDDQKGHNACGLFFVGPRALGARVVAASKYPAIDVFVEAFEL
jgi:hypothetical protein